MAVIHISEAGAARNLCGIMLRVNAGGEVIIDDGKIAAAMMPTSFPSRRAVSECIALAKKHEEESANHLYWITPLPTMLKRSYAAASLGSLPLQPADLEQPFNPNSTTLLFVSFPHREREGSSVRLDN